MEGRKGGMVGREEEGRDGKGNEGWEGEGRGRQGKGVSERRERGREMGGDSSIWIFVHAPPPPRVPSYATDLFIQFSKFTELAAPSSLYYELH